MKITLALLVLLLAGCATAPSRPSPVPYPYENVTIYGSSWIGGVVGGRMSNRSLLLGLEALGDQFVKERRNRRLTALLTAAGYGY